MMDLQVELLDEPMLEFASRFLHPDKKTGMAEYGPYGRSDAALHPAQILVGVVGTREGVETTLKWVESCRSRIETDRTRDRPVEEVDGDDEDAEVASIDAMVKGLYPDFPGFSSDGPFASTIVTSARWHSTFQDKEVKQILDRASEVERVERATDLLADHVERVATSTPHPQVILVCVPDALYEKASSAQLQNGWLDLRKGLKARAMKWGVPIQVLRQATAAGRGRSLQDSATRAWNFATTLYYKAGGVPWRGHGLEPNTCYVGVSFYQTEDAKGRSVMRSGVAQAFDDLGQGVVLRGDPFEWDTREHGRTPHLTTDGAAALMRATLEAYQKVSRLPPRRVVVHKTSRFWGASHGAHNEVDGFFQGIEGVNAGAAVDLVAILPSDLRLARMGNYPPLRGTLLTLGERRAVLYTHGFTPYFETYPGVHVPQPWHLAEVHGDSGIRTLAREILALTKMNVNNAAFSDGLPITLAFSRKVTDILKHVGPEMVIRSEYAFYT